MRIAFLIIVSLALIACENKQADPKEKNGIQPAVSSSNNTTGSAPPEQNDPVQNTSGEVGQQAPSDVGAPPANAQKKESGVHFVILYPGEGDATPTVDAIVTAEYTGWTSDGKKFDSSKDKGKPLVQRLGNLIKGWQEGVLGMKKGEVRRMWIPEHLGYGNNSDPSAPKGTIVFDVKLISFEEPK